MTVEQPTTYQRQKVLLLGATGFIGGEILYKLLTLPQFEKLDITILTRCYEKARKIHSTTQGRVRPIVGSVRDVFLMHHEFQRADIVINANGVDSIRCAKYLSKVASKVRKPYLILHTSGASTISATKGASDRVFSDLENNNEIVHTPVDEIILGIEERNPKFVKTVIVSPPTIFGRNDGFIRREAVSIPKLVKLAMKNKQAFTAYSGDYHLSHVHINDLADLYVMLLEHLLVGNKIKTGREGYYFAENGVHDWKDISAQIGKLLKQKGLVKTEEVAQLQPEQIQKLANDETAPYYWGTNAVTKADLARSYGWQPKFTTADLLNDLESTVDHIALQENY